MPDWVEPAVCRQQPQCNEHWLNIFCMMALTGWSDTYLKVAASKKLHGLPLPVIYNKAMFWPRQAVMAWLDARQAACD